MKYIGDSDLFTKGQFYTYAQISEVTGYSIPSLKNWLKKKYEFSDFWLQRKPKKKSTKCMYPIFNTRSEEISANYLKKRLVS